ncbi:AAA family ATPase [Lunatimonas salinarum]|uniref:AAA family ATPase n=1 Tax=Lunatimonas salinarum TaxID=1774590 RepID=UPI001ADFC712|nr:ATP-binding protein [Lunatimonas salinarum]
MPKRIVIIGPESTGKSTLSADLAAYFDEPWVPEYAREYLEEIGRPYSFSDLSEIAKGQLAAEERLSQAARRFLFCDTDLRVIQVWSEHKYGKLDSWIGETISRRYYDGYLLTSIDMPWEPDPLREHPDPGMRQYFYETYHELLTVAQVPFLPVAGSREERLMTAVEWIQRLYQDPNSGNMRDIPEI